MECFEEGLQKYILDLCKKNNVQIDLRFRCFGDKNQYWSSETNECFEVQCEHHYASDGDDVKRMMFDSIDLLWFQATKQNHRVALYFKNIVGKGDWIDVEFGACLFEDNSLL